MVILGLMEIFGRKHSKEAFGCWRSFGVRFEPHLVAKSNSCIRSVSSYLAVLVHCGVWPLQTEWNSESLRRRTSLILWRTRGEYPQYSGVRKILSVPCALTLADHSSSTPCPTNPSTRPSIPRRPPCSPTRTKATSQFTMSRKASRMPR